MIPLALVGYEMTIANSALPTSLAIISYSTRAHGIIVNINISKLTNGAGHIRRTVCVIPRGKIKTCMATVWSTYNVRFSWTTIDHHLCMVIFITLLVCFCMYSSVKLNPIASKSLRVNCRLVGFTRLKCNYNS